MRTAMEYPVINYEVMEQRIKQRLANLAGKRIRKFVRNRYPHVQVKVQKGMVIVNNLPMMTTAHSIAKLVTAVEFVEVDQSIIKVKDI